MLRVAVARALVIQPSCILADEPTGSLDSETGRRIIEVLMGLNRDEGVTLVIATHDPEVAAAAGRRIRLVDGRLDSRIEEARP